jgi:hypothetical protein
MRARSRDDAERIARDHLAASGFATFDLVFAVRTVAELVESRQQCPAFYRHQNLERRLASSWLVYVSDARPVALRSATLVVVSITDGAVLYSGSAQDEG